MTAPRTGTLIDILRHRAEEQTDRTAYAFPDSPGGAELSYGQLERRARALAVGLRQFAGPGDRILIICSPGVNYVVAFVASLYAGTIAVPVYPPRSGRSLGRLEGILRDSAPAALVADAPVTAMLSQFAGHPLLAGIAQLSVESVPDTDAGLAGPLPAADDVAVLQYTSGSTGSPKGVVVTHGNLTHNSALIAAQMRLHAESVCVSWLPPYHDMGLVGGILQPLFTGFLGVVMSPLTFLQRPLSWLEAITRYGGTVSGGPDFAFELCTMRHREVAESQLDLSTWKVAFTGSEPIKARTLERFEECFGSVGFTRRSWFPCYGMAETTLFISGGPPGREPLVLTGRSGEPGQQAERSDNQDGGPDVAPGGPDVDSRVVGCGVVPEGMTVRVVDRTTSAPVAAGQVGEIVAASESVTPGYWRRGVPEDSRITLPDDDRSYLRTGDLGFLWQGELFVTGRLKDVMIIRGRNYYPQDVEDTVERAHPAVRPHAVIAFAAPFEGQEQVVVVAELSGTRRDGLVEEVTAAIRAAVAEEHGLRVHTVTLVQTRGVPKTSNGKLQRSRCRQLFLDGDLPSLSLSVPGKARS